MVEMAAKQTIVEEIVRSAYKKLSATTSVTIKAIRRSSGRPLLLYRFHMAAARTVKCIEVRQLLKVLNAPNKLLASSAACLSPHSSSNSI
jgi:hypothetical protein